jgi:hypothetical protein
MAKEDIPGIIGGMKNALERGSSIEKAKESFITAGYDTADVEEAANSLGEKNFDKQASSRQSPKQVVPAQPLAALSLKMPEKPLPEIAKPESIKTKKKRKWLRNIIIFIAIILFLLILGIVANMLGLIKF